MDWFQRAHLGSRGASLLKRLSEERFVWDTTSAKDQDVLRKDVERIASDMDDPGRQPPMFWSGIPWPEAGGKPNCDYQLVVSIGGSKTEFALLRLEEGRVFSLDPRTGNEVSDPAGIDGIKAATQMVTPKHSPEVSKGEDLVRAMVAHFKRHFGARREALERCEAIFMSWGYPHRVVRTGPRLAGGLSAVVTLMTKDQAPFTESLLGKHIDQLFEAEFRSQLGWYRPMAVANDTVMALHYFLDPERRKGHARVGLFINGTGTNFSAAEPYAIRREGFISKSGEEYVPERITSRRPLGKDEREGLFFVNYEAGSIELAATRTRFDLEKDYPIERNALAGGNAFSQSLKALTQEFISKAVYAKIQEKWASLGGQDGSPPGAPMVSALARGAAVRDVVRGLEPADALGEEIQLVARAIVARSALHAALVLAAITRRTGFGKGKDGLPDLLGMEGSVWKIPGYQDLVRATWQDLVGKDPLRVDFSAEPSYNASLSGPLYMAAIHRS